MPPGSTAGGVTADKPFVASMGIYVFSREVLLEILNEPGIDFGKEIIPKSLGNHRVHPVHLSWLLGRRRHHRCVLRRQHPADAAGAPFNFFHPRFPIYTHPRFLPGTRTHASRLDSSIVAEGCFLDHCEVADSVVGIRTHIDRGSKVTRSILLGADAYEEETAAVRCRASASAATSSSTA